VYELTTKAYLAIKLDSISKEDTPNQTEENVALQILVALATVSPHKYDKEKSLH